MPVQPGRQHCQIRYLHNELLRSEREGVLGREGQEPRRLRWKLDTIHIYISKDSFKDKEIWTKEREDLHQDHKHKQPQQYLS